MGPALLLLSVVALSELFVFRTKFRPSRWSSLHHKHDVNSWLRDSMFFRNIVTLICLQPRHETGCDLALSMHAEPDVTYPFSCKKYRMYSKLASILRLSSKVR